MKKIIYLLIFIALNNCSRIPSQSEIEYRSRLENSIVKSFPKKVVVVIHPFENLSPGDTNRAYLETAIPDSIEAMLESLRSSLAYVPFDGMPFYVSSELSNLFQSVDVSITNEDGETNENIDTNDQGFYFEYLTNYLLTVPTQETQYNAITTTNTNYYTFITNYTYTNSVPVTNITSNEILITRTNRIDTNLIIVNKNLLTPTNMILLLYEEFPDLTNYLSFLPIELRRATDEDIEKFADYRLKIENPAQWRRVQRQREREAQATAAAAEAAAARENSTNTTPDPEVEPEASVEPSEPFEYIYHIAGDYRVQSAPSLLGPANIVMRMQVFPPVDTGKDWWEERFNITPPKLSEVLALDKSLDPTDMESYKTLFLRTPYTKPPVSPRLRDEFELYSTNFRDTRPATPTNPLPVRTRPLNLRLNVTEAQIPEATKDWLRYFHAIIINRPYAPLRVTTDPPNTLVYLNGIFLGQTPLTYSTAPIGPQRLLFIRDGFNREEILTEILPNQTNNIDFKLQALNNNGVLRVTSSLPDTEVFVNALYKGKTPLIVSNLTFGTKYRVEVFNPNSEFISNRNSVYTSVTLTENKPSIDFNAKFKDYDTMYKTPAQKGLLAATYISWFATFAIIGGSIYTDYRSREAQDLINGFGTPNGTPEEQDRFNQYVRDRDNFSIASQATLYSAIAAAVLSSGLTGWYVYSKQYYLGFDLNPEKNEWYAKFKIQF